MMLRAANVMQPGLHSAGMRTVPWLPSDNPVAASRHGRMMLVVG